MEDKLAKQIITGFADTRLVPPNLAYQVSSRFTPFMDNKLKEFFYFYTTFRSQQGYTDDAAWLGEKIMRELRNPEYDSLSSQPPPGTRIVFADE